MNETNPNINATASAKQWKRVPFDIELAKKIQSGEIDGRIVTSEDYLFVRIVDFNFKDKTDSIVYIGTYANGEQEFIQTCDNEGKSFGADVLFIELPEEEPKQYDEEGWEIGKWRLQQMIEWEEERQKKKFKPFDKVLVRRIPDYGNVLGTWTPAIFQKYVTEYNKTQYLASGLQWHECILFEGNEHLIGTTNNPNEK